MTEKMKEFPIFSQRAAALANERVKKDNLISQQVSRTLNLDVSEMGVESIRSINFSTIFLKLGELRFKTNIDRTRRDSIKSNSASYNTLSKESPNSPAVTPHKSPSVKTSMSIFFLAHFSI